MSPSLLYIVDNSRTEKEIIINIVRNIYCITKTRKNLENEFIPIIIFHSINMVFIIRFSTRVVGLA